MADNETWKMAKLAGDIGETIVYPLLVMPVWCWRTEKGVCHRWQDIQYKAQEGKADADVVISFGACDGCPMLEGVENAADDRQLHEIKTNVATFDKAIAGTSDRTQNLYIELIQSPYWYPKNKTEWETDLLEGGKKFPYRKGVGWYRKREHAFKEGILKYDKAHWYHFYQPYDAWERVKAAKDEDGNLLYPDLERPIGAEAKYQSATDEEIEKWLWDFNIGNAENATGKEAILITQMPVEVCISVPRDVLEKKVAEIEEELKEWGIPNRSNSKCFIDAGLLRAYWIAIKDIIPCVNMGTIKEEQRETQGEKGVLVNLFGEYVRWSRTDEKPHRIKGLIPKWAICYTPARLTGLMGEKLDWKALFRNPYDKAGAIWVPCEIKNFIEGLKKYGATGDI